MAFLLRDSMFRKKKTLLLFYFVIDLTTKTFNIKKGILGVTGTNTRQESELVLASLSNTVQMGSSSHKICITFGLLVLAHAAYSAAQHRAYLRLIKNDFTRLPLDILVQCLISLLIICYGVVHIAGAFKEIQSSAELENKNWEMLSNRQSFCSFNHRGKALFA
ncbi:membrane magnesium transporter 1 isoform X2 [Octopus sinensis]|uniref:Membrane magnesium transporter n=1 Tax=Octopus sinensis TaxID=2607531 RepID=A0A7E6FHY0_9MOLL|nr:membrane magnesium transporter 1 isoform X2 [Octopus sinensis]